MIVYVLRREGGEDDPRMRGLTAPEEAPIADWDGTGWVVRTRMTTTRDALIRRYRFELVDEEAEPARARAAPADELPTASEVRFEPEVTREQPTVGDDFRRWRRLRGDPERIDEVTAIDALDLVRRPFLVGEDAARVASALAAEGDDLDDVTIVLVCHGWGAFEQGAAERAIDVIRSLGPKARLSVVQNREAAPDGFLSSSWGLSHTGVWMQTTRNDGFAAACNAGARVARTRFLLFTQPDAWFGADAIRLAMALSLALAAEPSGGGRPAVIGPSGGYIPSWSPVFTEEGRNVDRYGAPVPVEWVGGYWMLVERAAWRKVGGMWDRSFLYCEEPDLCIRLAAEGARSFVWGDLPVNHQRGGTIRRRVAREQIAEIHEDARGQFARRWGGRPDLGLPRL